MEIREISISLIKINALKNNHPFKIFLEVVSFKVYKIF